MGERKEGSVNSNVKSNLAEEELLSNFDNDVRLSFAECISRMIAGYRDYLFYLNDEMPVFNKLDFMRDRILHNRRRLADSIPRKICLGRTRAEDEIDIER